MTYRTSMASRVGLVVTLLLVTAFITTATAARQPPTGTAMFVVRHDPRMCPSPACGGYWAALANAARTRCQDGLRHPRCHAAVAVDAQGRPVGDVPEDAIVRGAIDIGRGEPGELVVAAIYTPSGRAMISGGYYRVRDTGIRCVRAPCFSYRATQVNGSTGTRVSWVDASAAKVTAQALARATAALRTKDGLYARGDFSSGLDGGRVFHARRLFLRAALPRA